MRQAAKRRELINANNAPWNQGMHIFKTNHASEIKPLNDLKAKYK